jgi:hypothetical protein
VCVCVCVCCLHATVYVSSDYYFCLIESVEEDLLVSFDGAAVYRPWRGPAGPARRQPTKV